jgi:hypothetical protein
MAVLQSDGVNHTSDLILRRNGTEGLRLTSSTVQVSSINNGPLAGFRNAIINGNFDIWQRGTSFTAFAYGVDRWINNISSSTCTMSRQAFTLGQTDVPGEPTYFCRMSVSSVAGAGNYSILQHRIESVRTFAGQTVSISFWAKADAAKPIAIELEQNFGTGGSPSSTVFSIGTTKTTLSASWQKVTVTANVSSISGKTLGTNNNDFLALNIWFDAGSNLNARTDSLGQQSGTFDIAQVQLEPGTVATPFERRNFGQELALCQRYFQKGEGDGFGKRMYNNTGNFVAMNVSVDFPVTMRTSPTITVTVDINDAAPIAGGAQGIDSSISGFSAFTFISSGLFLDYHSHTASAEL